MFHLLLVAVSVFAIFGMPSLDSLIASGPVTEYLVAIGVALMLMPWLKSQFE